MPIAAAALRRAHRPNDPARIRLGAAGHLIPLAGVIVLPRVRPPGSAINLGRILPLPGNRGDFARLEN